MAIWSTPATWQTGNALTASELNTEVRDNLNYLHDRNEGARAYNSAAISIPNGTTTLLTYDSEDWDSDDLHDTSSNTERLTVQTAGKYLVVAQIGFVANATGVRLGIMYHNTSVGVATVIAEQLITAVGAGSYMDFIISTLYDFDVDEYVTVKVYQSSGGALNTAGLLTLSMIKVGE